MSFMQSASCLRRIPTRQAPSLRRMGISSPVIPASRRHNSTLEPSPLPSAWTTVVDYFNALSASVADNALQLHAAGIPWWATIPIVAAGVNFTIRLPLQAYSRKLEVRRAKVQPVIDAWAKRNHVEVSSLGRSERETGLEIFKRNMRTRKRIYKNFHCQMFKSWSVVTGFIPFWAVSYGLRRISSGELADPVATGMTEGGLAWFTDLTVHDPYFILPVACCVALAGQVYRGMTHRQVLETLTFTDKWKKGTSGTQEILRRLIVMSPWLPIMAGYAPAALFLYWLPTFLLSRVNYKILDIWNPVPKRTMTPAKASEASQAHPWLHSSLMEPYEAKKASPAKADTASSSST